MLLLLLFCFTFQIQIIPHGVSGARAVSRAEKEVDQDHVTAMAPYLKELKHVHCHHVPMKQVIQLFMHLSMLFPRGGGGGVGRRGYPRD